MRRKECSCFTSKVVPRCGVVLLVQQILAQSCGTRPAAIFLPSLSDSVSSLGRPPRSAQTKIFPAAPIPKSLLPCDGQRRDGDFPNRVRLVCENEGRVPDRGMDSRPGREAKCAPGGRARLEMEAMIPHIKTVRGRNGGNTGASGMGASQNREQSSPDLESCDRRPP